LLVELSNVHKHFGRNHVLKGISARIPEGMWLALIGPNGSGKSTLIRALLGLVECEGQVLLDGRPPYEDRVAVARKLAYVPQIAPQLSAPVDDILRTICITRQLGRARIVEVAHRLELDLAVLGPRPFRNLSGGMKQKLLLAVALAARPSLLVLDEPTASLDARARARLLELFDEQVGPEVTVILCSHRLEEVEALTDHVLALDEGRVCYDGPVDRAAALLNPAPAAVEAEGHS
jgi:ABC-2 type transport system ATP-binding protein